MMKRLSLILVLIACNLFSMSSNLKVTLSNNSTSKKFILTAGVDSLATDGWDKDLEGISYPTVFPPNTFMAYLETIDSSQVNEDGSKYYDYLWLDKDLKVVPADIDKFHKRYKVVFNWGLGTVVSVTWNNNQIDKHIDSAFVVDAFDGLVFKHNMRDTNSFDIKNDGIRFFYIDVYFSKIPLSVSDVNSNQIELYPNPTSGFINLNNYDEIKSIKLFDINGVDLSENIKMNINNMIDVSFIQSGLYFLEITFLNDRKIYKNFTKCN